MRRKGRRSRTVADSHRIIYLHLVAIHLTKQEILSPPKKNFFKWPFKDGNIVLAFSVYLWLPVVMVTLFFRRKTCHSFPYFNLTAVLSADFDGQ